MVDVGSFIYHGRMATRRTRTYVVYRSTFWERPYLALGPVVASSHAAALEIARQLWHVDALDTQFHVRAAGSASSSLRREALALDAAVGNAKMLPSTTFE